MSKIPRKDRILTPWFAMFRGDLKHIPRSSGQGLVLAQRVLAPIQAQIAAYFGAIDGSLASLQEGAQKLHKGEPIICQSCNQDIWKDGHLDDCQLSEQYLKVMNPPAP